MGFQNSASSKPVGPGPLDQADEAVLALYRRFVTVVAERQNFGSPEIDAGAALRASAYFIGSAPIRYCSIGAMAG